jgi:hypothetical protein
MFPRNILVTFGRAIICISLQLAGPAAFSQQQEFRFTHVGTEEGLSQSNVTCILQDSR